MSIYKEFGKRLADIRQTNDLSQKQLAEKLNIPQSTYAGYETGSRKIPLDLIVELSKIFRISPTILILGDEINIIDDFIPQEQELIKKYRLLTDEQQGAVNANINYFIELNKSKNEENINQSENKV